MNTIRRWVTDIGAPFRPYLPATAASAVGWVTVLGITGVIWSYARKMLMRNA